MHNNALNIPFFSENCDDHFEQIVREICWNIIKQNVNHIFCIFVTVCT